MAWDSVPWFVGGGAEHSPEVARMFAYAALGGAEGVIQSGDLKVSAQSTPGGSVSVAAGGAIILSRATGETQQSYVGRHASVDSVSIAATTSSGARSDLIVAQIEDPFLSGEPWTDPADPTVGPYIFTRVISNVPAGTTSIHSVSGYSGRTAITLARIDIPASTAAITNAMITDLRRVARPRTERTINQYANAKAVGLTASSAVPFPSASLGSIYIPSWASAAHIQSSLVGASLQSSAATGYIGFRIGPDGGTQVATRTTYYNEQVAGGNRLSYLVADDVSIPSSMRGTTQPLWLYANRSAGSGNLYIATDAQVFYDIEFAEAAS